MRSAAVIVLLVAFSFAKTALGLTVYTQNVCPVGQIAYLDAAGVGACGIPSTVYTNPSFTRCPSFTFLRTVVTVTLGPTTTTFACSTFPSLCPQGFSYVVASVSGDLSLALTCNKLSTTTVSVATASCQRVGGTYVILTGICLAPSAPSTGFAANNQNCRLVTQANAGSAAQPCTATGR
ncbi:hypothetical protein BDY24DRAFT_196183 [Mrakia frigida]|uniref:uncharacterized protein n=1 Tax=Mrakia frigida TaxID=29902 RepID=UPI003FCC1A3A